MFLHRGSVQVVAGLLIFWACISFGSSQDDQVKVFFSKARIQKQENTLLTINLVVSGIFRENFTCNLTFTSMTAMEFQDFLPIDRSADFVVGRTMSSAVRIAMVKDGVWEGTENLRVTFDLPVGNTNIQKGSPDSLQISILDTNVVQVSFMNGTVSTREPDGPVTLALNSYGAYNREFPISIQCNEVDPPQAINGADYSFSRSRVTFNDFDREETVSSEFEIDILDDFISESTESFICFLLTPFGTTGIIAGEPNTLTVNIFDDDELEVHFSAATYQGIEGSAVEVNLNASRQFSTPFEVEVFAVSLSKMVLGQTSEAISGKDYANPSLIGGGRLQFDNSTTGLMSTSMFINLIQDEIVETDEKFGIRFAIIEGDIDLNISSVSPLTAIVTITNDDILYVRFINPSITVDESEPSIEVYLEAVQEDPDNPGSYVPAKFEDAFQARIVVQAGTAKVRDDYRISGSSRDVIFKRGTTISTPLKINIINDEVSECNETFTLSLRIAGVEKQKRVKIIPDSSNTSVVTIEDDDITTVEFQQADYSVSETENIKSVFLITKGTFEGDRTFKIIDMPLTAEANQDYILQTSSAILRDGSTISDPINVMIVNDDLSEDIEEMTLALSIPQDEIYCNAIYGGLTTTNLTIDDNDKLLLNFERLSQNVSEGETFVNIGLVLGGAMWLDTAIEIEVYPVEDGSAESTIDFNEIHKVATFSASQSMPSVVAIGITDDYVSEPTESFKVELTIPEIYRYRISSDNPSTVVTILDDDVSNIFFNESVINVREMPDDNIVTLNLFTDGSFANDQTIQIFTTNGTAIEGSDYELLTKEVIITAGANASSDIQLKLLNNDVTEGVHTFTVTFSLNDDNMMNNARIGNPMTIIVNIIDDEVSVLEFTEPVVYIKEASTPDPNNVQLMLTSNLIFESTQNYKVVIRSGTATAGEDYTLITDTITLTAGENLATPIIVQILNDDTVEELFEDFYVTVEIPPNSGGILGPIEEVNVFIEDDDKLAVSFEISLANVVAREDEGVIGVKFVLREGTVFEAFNISFALESGTATEFLDYYIRTAGDFDVENIATFERFSNESTEATIRLVDDLECEENETFTLVASVSNETANRVDLVSPITALATIIDNDFGCDQPAILSFEDVLLTVSECDGTVNIPVLRVGTINTKLIIPVNVTELTARNGEDFNVKTPSIEFSPAKKFGEVANIVIDILADGQEETNNEGFSLSLVLPDAISFRRSSITVIIEDDNLC